MNTETETETETAEIIFIKPTKYKRKYEKINRLTEEQKKERQKEYLKTYYHKHRAEQKEKSNKYYHLKYQTNDDFKEKKRINSYKNYYKLTDEDIQFCNNNYNNIKHFVARKKAERIINEYEMNKNEKIITE